MADEAAARDWVMRVLGIPVSGSTGGPKLMPIWLDAKDAVDAGIERLARALREHDDPDLTRIAEYGLNGVTDKRSVGLMVALREADDGTAGAGQKLGAAVQSFRSFLDGDPVVDLIEDNPFDISVGLRATLGRALDELDRNIAA